MSPLVLAAVIGVGAALLVVALLVGLVFARRRTLAKLGILIVAAAREGEQPWQVGLLRFDRHDLQWHSLFGLSTRPRRTWARDGLDLEAPQPLDAADAPPVLEDAELIRCHAREGDFDLALPRAAYTALRSWVESSPPGIGVNVA